MLFTTFFSQLPGNEYHVNCAAFTPKPALRFRQDKIYNVLRETGEHDVSQNITCHREKEDGTTVATFCSVTFLHVCKNNVGIFRWLWETLSDSTVRDIIMHPSEKSTSTILNDLSRDVVRTGCSVVTKTENGLFHFVKDGWSSSFGMIGSVSRSSRKPGSVVFALSSRFCRYSANLARIISLFLIRAPSIHVTGCNEKRVGP